MSSWLTSNEADILVNIYSFSSRARYIFFPFFLSKLMFMSWLITAVVSLTFSVVMMILNNASAPPFSFHILYCAYRPRRVECFQLFMIQSCAKSVFFPHCFSPGGFERGKATHAVINVPPFRWAITLISDRLFWCAEWQSKINRERKAVKDLQCSALINEGLYQLGAHDWCVNISAVTQFGTQRRVTPLFTEHKDHKQALATSAVPSVNSWAFTKNLRLQHISEFGAWFLVSGRYQDWDLLIIRCAFLDSADLSLPLFYSDDSN